MVDVHEHLLIHIFSSKFVCFLVRSDTV